MACTCILVVTTECNTHHFRCEWSKADPVKGIDDQRHESLNIVLYPKNTLITQTEGINGVASAVCYDDEQNDDKEFNTPRNLTPEITSFIIESINKCKGVDDKSPVIMNFILSREDGYLARSDFLQQRLDGVKHVSWVVGFLRPLQQVSTLRVQINGTAHDLSAHLSLSVGAILLDTSSGSGLHDTLDSVEEALCNRISYPWVVSTPIPRKRLAWVEGRKDADASRRMYEAAAALGITLVIIDKPGHWSEDDYGPYAHLREGFIATNIDVNEGFVDRIVTAVRSYDKPIDGIMTVSDSRLIGVARACEILGYPTSPSSAYVLAGDKYRTRMMEPDTHGAFRVFGTDELEKVLQSTEVKYPLIVKPCLGWGSQAVTKVSTEVELFEAVEKACECHALSPQQRSDAVIEPYIDGPEVDANFVLLNGEVIFCEISDDFPSPGDRDSQQSHNFVETMVHMPSALPPHELKAIRETLHQSILRQGFSTGTFHCEARLQYSSHEFRQDDNGFEDLNPRRDTDSNNGRSARVYLLEINARPAGYLETVGVNLVYGVDYFAQQMLFSVNDELRFKALCHQFPDGPRSNLSILVLQEDVAGIMKTEDATAELLRQHPELEPHVPLYATIKKKGDKLVGPKSSEVHFIAWMLVMAQKRRECLRLVEQIRSNFRYEVE
ncbi:glutathione synthetase ATP-binding domain-like protein [Aspergillus vadensis CBS 113365]|uniref:Glutathione synthetase ATP-binding domain-like protein n=1 Tax=Aspergillus vadensis (strain CBS 113365 / IMI 142717 / IBT 24658) TaxID=1448311 RepID=A0A319C3D5_ASPVC|nr:glutathione synthetase ATP-binding domain-like protein [Aspergillus vadensis CBS 113365]PYH69938.1 glutathione synthetase ATP-binding domain-like protein [Aspergillus vadensis CBS 113365]